MKVIDYFKFNYLVMTCILTKKNNTKNIYFNNHKYNNKHDELWIYSFNNYGDIIMSDYIITNIQREINKNNNNIKYNNINFILNI